MPWHVTSWKEFTATHVLYPNSSSFEGIKEKNKDNIIYSMQDATSYYYNFNLDRQSYNHTSKQLMLKRQPNKKQF